MCEGDRVRVKVVSAVPRHGQFAGWIRERDATFFV